MDDKHDLLTQDDKAYTQSRNSGKCKQTHNTQTTNTFGATQYTFIIRLPFLSKIARTRIKATPEICMRKDLWFDSSAVLCYSPTTISPGCHHVD